MFRYAMFLRLVSMINIGLLFGRKKSSLALEHFHTYRLQHLIYVRLRKISCRCRRLPEASHHVTNGSKNPQDFVLWQQDT